MTAPYLAVAEAVAWGGKPAPAVMVAADWRPITKGTLRGFFILRLASRLTLRECALHEKAAARWIALPGRAQIDPDGKQRINPATGKRLYIPVVEITDKEARERFRSQALAAIDRLLPETTAPEPSSRRWCGAIDRKGGKFRNEIDRTLKRAQAEGASQDRRSQAGCSKSRCSSGQRRCSEVRYDAERISAQGDARPESDAGAPRLGSEHRSAFCLPAAAGG